MSDLENTLWLDLKTSDGEGRVTVRLKPEVAPKHVARIKELARDGFYDGIVFHRVIAGFMAQGGDPTGTGMSGSGQNLDAEFNDVPHDRGVCSMARAQDPNSADSQFFICLAESHFLNGQYTVWGAVSDGMEHVDALAKGEPPAEPSAIIMASIAADAAS